MTAPPPTADPRAGPGLTLAVWGCRGSTPAPGPETLRYGGDTSCYALTAPCGARLVVDAGSGLRNLGAVWRRGGGDVSTANILLTHLHVDHLLGLAAFEPLILGVARVGLWTVRPAAETRQAVRRLFSPPLFPTDLLEARPVDVRRLDAAATRIGPFEVTAFPLSHPGGAAGFVIRAAARRVVFAVDHEHGHRDIDAELVRMAAAADLLIYDATFSAQDYPARRGWGHSTREEGVRLAAEAGARHVILTHHAPGATDAALDAAAEALAAETEDGGPRVTLARDGLEVVC